MDYDQFFVSDVDKSRLAFKEKMEKGLQLRLPKSDIYKIFQSLDYLLLGKIENCLYCRHQIISPQNRTRFYAILEDLYKRVHKKNERKQDKPDEENLVEIDYSRYNIQEENQAPERSGSESSLLENKEEIEQQSEKEKQHQLLKQFYVSIKENIQQVQACLEAQYLKRIADKVREMKELSLWIESKLNLKNVSQIKAKIEEMVETSQKEVRQLSTQFPSEIQEKTEVYHHQTQFPSKIQEEVEKMERGTITETRPVKMQKLNAISVLKLKIKEEKKQIMKPLGNQRLFCGNIFNGFVPVKKDPVHITPFQKERHFLIDSIEKLKNRKIKVSKLLYRYNPYRNDQDFHLSIDQIPNIVFIVKLQNGFIVAAYSENDLRPQQVLNGVGFLASLTNQEIFEPKANKELIPHKKYAFVVGKDDLRVKIPDEKIKVHSNLGIANTTAFATNKDAEVLFGTKERDQLGQQYEVFKVFFEEN